VTETLYDWPDANNCNGLKVKKETNVNINDVTYMHDKIGLHKVANNGSEAAVTLHLYSPPYEYCKTFCERTGMARQSGRCVFHSVKGQINPVAEDLKIKFDRSCKPTKSV
jgi:cysteine dioxygenase